MGDVALSCAYAALYIGVLLVVGDVHLLQTRLQVVKARSSVELAAVSRARRRAHDRRRAGRGRARAAVPDARAGRRDALPPLGPDAAPADARLQRARGRPLLDPRGPGPTAAPSASLGTEQQAAAGTSPVAVDPARRRYDLLYPLLDLTTTLDPRFNIAYRFGAIFLAEPYPAGPGRPDLAIALLEKGLRERPDKWEYMQDIGFVYYWWLHDYKSAAAWFDRASRVPGAPIWLQPLAATTLAQGGDRRSSRLMWESILQSAEVDWLRQRGRAPPAAAARPRSDRRAAARPSIASSRRPDIRPPTGRRSRAPGCCPACRVDPTGTPYVIQNGKVTLAPDVDAVPAPG